MNRVVGMPAILLLFPLSVAACSDPVTQNGSSSSSSGSMGSSSGDGGMGGAGMGGGGGAGGASGGNGGMGGGNAGVVPANGAELFPWLQAGNYKALIAESAIHASTGPHGGQVLTFVNPILFDALTAGSTNFPEGSASVKELWGNGTKLNGWAVFVKTQANSANGAGFYWYENYSTTDPSSPVADGNGVGLCSGCHSTGTDYFLSPFPLQ